MIGAGVFTTSGFALADLGRRDAVLWAWGVGGVIALCGALSYAGLARRIPGSGGEYLFLSRRIHPLAGFLAGWTSLLAGFTAPIAVAAHGLEAYAAAVLDTSAWPRGGLGAGALLAAGLAHGVSRAPGLRLQGWAVGLKLAAIVAFIAFGAFRLLADGAVPTAPTVGDAIASSGGGEAGPPIAAFAVTLVWVSFAYSGWNAAVYVAGEIEAPERTLPRAMLLGTLVVAVLYVALNAVFVHAAPIEQLAGRAEVGAIAAEALGGAPARTLLSAIVALGLLTSISSMVMVGPRVYAQMAADGLLPRGLVPADETPRAAVWLQVALALVVFFASGLRELLLYTGFLLGLSAATSVACLFVVPERPGERPVPGHPVVPALFVLATLGSAAFMLQREPVAALAGGATLLVGAGVYGIVRWQAGASGPATLRAPRDEGPPPA